MTMDKKYVSSGIVLLLLTVLLVAGGRYQYKKLSSDMAAKEALSTATEEPKKEEISETDSAAEDPSEEVLYRAVPADVVTAEGLRVNHPENAEAGKIIYLTFDDGPSMYTAKLLGILDKYNVKATFFVTDMTPEYEYMIYEERSSGHSVGVHSYSHVYDKIYESEDAFWADFNLMNNVIYKYTGKKTDIMRFPGGSSNEISKFNPGIMTRLVSETGDRGLYYFDWNVICGDADGAKSSAEIYNNIVNGVAEKIPTLEDGEEIVILCHDNHEITVNAMEDVINWGLDQGYTFLPLTKDSYPKHHTIHN